MAAPDPEHVKKVIDAVSRQEISDLAEYVARHANIQDYVARVDYSDLLSDCAKDLCTTMTPNVELDSRELTTIHVNANRFSKKSQHSERFMDKVERIMDTDEFKLEIQNKIASIVSELTGFYPNAPQVVDMEVSSGSSPASAFNGMEPPPPAPPQLVQIPVPPPIPMPNYIPLPPGPAPNYPYPQ